MKEEIKINHIAPPMTILQQCDGFMDKLGRKKNSTVAIYLTEVRKTSRGTEFMWACSLGNTCCNTDCTFSKERPLPEFIEEEEED